MPVRMASALGGPQLHQSTLVKSWNDTAPASANPRSPMCQQRTNLYAPHPCGSAQEEIAPTLRLRSAAKSAPCLRFQSLGVIGHGTMWHVLTCTVRKLSPAAFQRIYPANDAARRPIATTDRMPSNHFRSLPLT